MAKRDYYQVLGVPRSADQAAIRRAFRRLAKQYHPDTGSGDPSRFHEINEAYQVLNDARQRAQYDKTLAPIYRPPNPRPAAAARPSQPSPPVHSSPQPATTTEYITAIAALLITLFCVGMTYGVSQLMTYFQGGQEFLDTHMTEESGQRLMGTAIAGQTATAASYPTAVPAPELIRRTRSATTMLEDIRADLRRLTGVSCVVDLVENTHSCGGVYQVRVTAGPYNNAVALQVDLDPRQYDLTRVIFRVEYGARTPQGITVNIGDSQSNQGQGGDNGNHEHNAELVVNGSDLTVFGSHEAGHLSRQAGAIKAETLAYFEISDQAVRWVAGDHAEALESRYLYALGGQYDRLGRDYIIYAGFNRPARLGRTDFGSGIVRVQIYLLPPG